MSFIGRHISSLPTPALIVDKDKVFFLHFLFIHLVLAVLLNICEWIFLVWSQLPQDAGSGQDQQDLSSSSDQNPQNCGRRRSAGAFIQAGSNYLQAANVALKYHDTVRFAKKKLRLL